MNVHIRVILCCVVLCIICLILLLSGCAYSHAVIGQTADVLTTTWGMHEGLSEGNPIVGDSFPVLVALKAVLLVAAYYVDSDDLNSVLATVGWLAAAWNVAVIAENSGL